MVKHLIAEHDVVALRDKTSKWEAGTKGTVVSDYGAVKLVEIADEQGVALDYIQVPEPALKLPARYSH